MFGSKKNMFEKYGDSFRKHVLEKLRRGNVNNENGSHTLVDRARNMSGFQKFKFWLKTIFGYSKRDKTGRYGQKKAKKRKDDIARLANKKEEYREEMYFDPFENDMDETVNAPESSRKIHKGDSIREKLEKEYNSRVIEQMEINTSSDFEAEKDDLQAQHEDVMVRELSQKVDEDTSDKEINKLIKEEINKKEKESMGGFVQDGGYPKNPDAIPQKFTLAVGVALPKNPMIRENFAKLSRLSAEELIQSHGSKRGTKDERARNRAKQVLPTTSEYKSTVTARKKMFAKLGKEYDETKDPDIKAMEDSLARIDLRDTGHAKVGLIGKDEQGNEITRYTFGFMHTRENANIGLLSNPDALDGQFLNTYDITFGNYLNAAAKIRGVKGSLRSYSLNGYNCTAFAADVANAAGVSFKPEQVADDFITNEAVYHRVDSPYRLATTLKKQTTKDEEKDRESKRSVSDLYLAHGQLNGENKEWGDEEYRLPLMSFIDKISQQEFFKGDKTQTRSAKDFVAALIDKIINKLSERKMEGQVENVKNEKLTSYLTKTFGVETFFDLLMSICENSKNYQIAKQEIDSVTAKSQMNTMGQLLSGMASFSGTEREKYLTNDYKENPLVKKGTEYARKLASQEYFINTHPDNTFEAAKDFLKMTTGGIMSKVYRSLNVGKGFTDAEMSETLKGILKDKSPEEYILSIAESEDAYIDACKEYNGIDLYIPAESELNGALDKIDMGDMYINNQIKREKEISKVKEMNKANFVLGQETISKVDEARGILRQLKDKAKERNVMHLCYTYAGDLKNLPKRYLDKDQSVKYKKLGSNLSIDDNLFLDFLLAEVYAVSEDGLGIAELDNFMDVEPIIRDLPKHMKDLKISYFTGLMEHLGH